MPIIRIPSPLRSYTKGQSEVSVNGKIVSEAMEDLVLQFPTLQPHLYNQRGELRPFVNLFLNQENIKDLQSLDTPLGENDRLLLIPSIAGGGG
jgi:molybdopterin converting factor small subunit